MVDPRRNVVFYRHMEATARPKKVIFAFNSSSSQQALKISGHEQKSGAWIFRALQSKTWCKVRSLPQKVQRAVRAISGLPKTAVGTTPDTRAVNQARA